MERARTRLEALLLAATDAVSAANAPPQKRRRGWILPALRHGLARAWAYRARARLLLLALVGGEHSPARPSRHGQA